MTEKTYKGILILNWKSGEMRVLKRHKGKFAPFEIPVKLDITIELPSNPEIVAKGRITIPEYKAKEMVIDTLLKSGEQKKV